ncbi:MAG: tetratricopeptide repeat protein, partial [Gemmatimonadetes bacterium]|nr:tetratricopeptide repeat protein [Gemmatimonadota bacterium]
MRLAVNPSTLTVLACVSLGCAYYNGLYNANRLANEAGKAEREGRRGEAQSLWTRAAVKAESVATRYPDSKYYDDALLLQGRALSRIGECRDAVRPLHAAVTESVDGELRVEAALLLGRCQLEVGETDTAWATLSALVDHDDPSVTSRALYWRGRAALAAGRPAAALDDLKRTAEPTALFDRALAMTELGFTREAASTLDTASALTFAEDRWAQVLARLGAVDLQSASALVERLLARNDLT